MDFKNRKDHWAFLEEIDAPMWVDLTVDVMNYSQDFDDKWFRTSHLFHQCPSRQLKSAFSRLGEDGIALELELDFVAPSSPTLPHSVSRSRGKDYKSKKWKGTHHDVSSNKIQPIKVLNEKSSGSDTGLCEGIKPKMSFVSLKGTSSSKACLVSEITEEVKGKNVKPVSTCGGPKKSSNPVADKSDETNSRSTVTSESIQQQEQQQKFFEVSSRDFGQTSRLLSSMRNSLIRKSCITRPATRVEIKADGRERRERKSSSSKSSVGSSSYTGYDVKRSTSAWIKKEKTPDSRNVARMTEAAKNKVKASNMRKLSNVRGKEGNRISMKEGLATVGKPTCLEATKSKANSQTLSKLSLRPKVNEQKSLAAATKAREKVGVGRINKVIDAGKENNTGENSLSQKCIAAGGTVTGRKGTGQSTSQKGHRMGMVVSKGRVGNQRERKSSSSANITQKVYFR